MRSKVFTIPGKAAPACRPVRTPRWRTHLWLGLVLAGVLVLAAGPARAAAARIVLDGRFEEWTPIAPAVDEPAGDHGDCPVDLRGLKLAHDERYLYLYIELYPEINLQASPAPIRLHFDTDRDPATGFRIGPIGSDLVIMLPEKRGAEQGPGIFETAAIRHPQLGLAWETTLSNRRFELRIDRFAASPTLQAPLFSRADFELIVTAGEADGQPQDWMPSSAAIVYRFTGPSLPPWPAIPLEKRHPDHIRLMSYNMLWGGLVKRPEHFDRILRALRPDLVCFQEVGRSFQQRDHFDVEISPAAIGRRLDELLPLEEGRRWQIHAHRSCVIASRWPLTLKSTDEDVAFATGVGQAMALVDLPDHLSRRDLYLICMHTRCCGRIGSPEDQDRQKQSDGNIAWLRELRTPGGRVTLPADTPFILCGDLNLVGGMQVLRTLLTGDIIDEAAFGADAPPDWDGTPLVDLRPLHNAAPAAYTWRDDASDFTPGRLDAILYSDSVLRVARAFVLNTLDMSEEDLARHNLRRDDVLRASDHLPLVADFLPGPDFPETSISPE